MILTIIVLILLAVFSQHVPSPWSNIILIICGIVGVLLALSLLGVGVWPLGHAAATLVL